MISINAGKGFTLIEVMVVLVILTGLTALLIPNIHDFSRTADRSAAQQEMLRISELLERHKSRNLSYRGFSLANFYPGIVQNNTDITLPIGATGSAVKYTIKLVDLDAKTALTDASVTGRNWAITAIKSSSSAQAKNYDMLLTSTGIRCMTSVTSADVSNLIGCGVKSESW